MDTRQFIAEHLHDDVHELALRTTDARVDMTLALRQIEARQLLQKKVPSWSNNEDLLFPPHLSVEQCSSEATARYKASLFHGDSFVDLTGGLGVDCHFISQGFVSTDYVESNTELCSLAQHNFTTLGDPIRVHNESAEAFLQHCECYDAMFIDPARRDTAGRKVVSITDCSPNLVELQDLMMQKSRRVIVKLSPMLDISQALKVLHGVKEVHVVAVDNECKELLFLMASSTHNPTAENQSGEDNAPLFTCVNLQSGQEPLSFTLEDEQDSPLCLASSVAQYLYEPNAALLKGGCFKLLTQRFEVQKLHRHSHLYTSEMLIPNFPGRIFSVEAWAPYNKRIRQTLLADVEKASIATRNFPLSVAELRKTLKINDGDTIYLFATTLSGEQKILIKTTKVV